MSLQSGGEYNDSCLLAPQPLIVSYAFAVLSNYIRIKLERGKTPLDIARKLDVIETNVSLLHRHPNLKVAGCHGRGMHGCAQIAQTSTIPGLPP